MHKSLGEAISQIKKLKQFLVCPVDNFDNLKFYTKRTSMMSLEYQNLLHKMKLKRHILHWQKNFILMLIKPQKLKKNLQVLTMLMKLWVMIVNEEFMIRPVWQVMNNNKIHLVARIHSKDLRGSKDFLEGDKLATFNKEVVVLETFLKNLKKCLVVRVVGNVDQAIESNNKKGVILQFI